MAIIFLNLELKSTERTNVGMKSNMFFFFTLIHTLFTSLVFSYSLLNICFLGLCFEADRQAYVLASFLAFHRSLASFFSFLQVFYSPQQLLSWQNTSNSNWAVLSVTGWGCSIIHSPLKLPIAKKYEAPLWSHHFLLLFCSLHLSCFPLYFFTMLTLHFTPVSFLIFQQSNT